MMHRSEEMQSAYEFFFLWVQGTHYYTTETATTTSSPSRTIYHGRGEG